MYRSPISTPRGPRRHGRNGANPRETEHPRPGIVLARPVAEATSQHRAKWRVSYDLGLAAYGLNYNGLGIMLTTSGVTVTTTGAGSFEATRRGGGMLSLTNRSVVTTSGDGAAGLEIPVLYLGLGTET